MEGENSVSNDLIPISEMDRDAGVEHQGQSEALAAGNNDVFPCLDGRWLGQGVQLRDHFLDRGALADHGYDVALAFDLHFDARSEGDFFGQTDSVAVSAAKGSAGDGHKELLV